MKDFWIKREVPPIYLPWLYGFLGVDETHQLAEYILEHSQGIQSQGPPWCMTGN